MSSDISSALDKWPFEPGKILVRKFKGRDGFEKIQLRVDLGILQMNVDGRPDGKRPFGHESLFDHFVHRLEHHRTQRDGDNVASKLSGEDCSRLQQEAIQYHHRYICFLELGDFDRVLRDTERNLTLFDFAQDHAESHETAWPLQQFRPQLLLMQTRAKGTLALQQMKFHEAISTIEEGMDAIRTFFHSHARTDLLPQNPELLSLEAWLAEVHSKRPLSRREQLERALDDAIQNEDYERAAEVRDALRQLLNPD